MISIDRFELDRLNKDINEISKAIGKRMKESKGQDKCEVRYFVYLFNTRKKKSKQMKLMLGLRRKRSKKQRL